MPVASERTALNRAAVLAAAVALADREGLEAVSMRRLAQSLGVVPMALYKHVADKDDLLEGMVGAVIAQFEPATRDDWQAGVRETVLSARRVLARHPWARRAIEAQTRRTPAVLGHMETVTRWFLDGGFSPDLAHHAMHALGNRIWGFSPELFPDDGARPSHGGARPDPADYPAILAVAAEAQRLRPGLGCDEDFEFRFALDLTLDALAKLHGAGWSSRR